MAGFSFASSCYYFAFTFSLLLALNVVFAKWNWRGLSLRSRRGILQKWDGYAVRWNKLMALSPQGARKVASKVDAAKGAHEEVAALLAKSMEREKDKAKKVMILRML